MIEHPLLPKPTRYSLFMGTTGAREAIARFLEKIDLKPIILHEQASRGRRIIEKVEAHRNVSCAVVLPHP